jgi:hypothetical protein
MDFSPGRDALPSQARSVRGAFRRADNAKTLIFRCMLRWLAPSAHAVLKWSRHCISPSEPPLTLSPLMIACQGTTQAR